jgi:hypothetical protein
MQDGNELSNSIVFKMNIELNLLFVQCTAVLRLLLLAAARMVVSLLLPLVARWCIAVLYCALLISHSHSSWSRFHRQGCFGMIKRYSIDTMTGAVEPGITLSPRSAKTAFPVMNPQVSWILVGS